MVTVAMTVLSGHGDHPPDFPHNLQGLIPRLGSKPSCPCTTRSDRYRTAIDLHAPSSDAQLIVFGSKPVQPCSASAKFGDLRTSRISSVFHKTRWESEGLAVTSPPGQGVTQFGLIYNSTDQDPVRDALESRVMIATTAFAYYCGA